MHNSNLKKIYKCYLHLDAAKWGSHQMKSTLSLLPWGATTT